MLPMWRRLPKEETKGWISLVSPTNSWKLSLILSFRSPGIALRAAVCSSTCDLFAVGNIYLLRDWPKCLLKACGPCRNLRSNFFTLHLPQANQSRETTTAMYEIYYDMAQQCGEASRQTAAAAMRTHYTARPKSRELGKNVDILSLQREL
jgi:hypothetical protein